MHVVDQSPQRSSGGTRAYLGGANLPGVLLVGIALLLTSMTAWRMFATCNTGSDYLGLGAFFLSFVACALAGIVFALAGLVAMVQKQWKRLVGAAVGGVLCMVLGFAVPYVSQELSNCPPASPGGPIFAQSHPFQKCLARHGGYEIDFVSPDIADYEDLIRGMVVARPPRTVIEEVRPRHIASVLLFRDEQAAREYSTSIGIGSEAPERIREAWFLVRYGTEALGRTEREAGAAALRWSQPTREERAAVDTCVAAIPTWWLTHENRDAAAAGARVPKTGSSVPRAVRSR